MPLPIDVLKFGDPALEVSAIYWKIEFDHGSFPYNNFVREIEMHSTLGGSNQSVGGITGSASGNGVSPGNAFDGNSATSVEWSWPETAPYIVFHFNSAINIKEFTWKFADGGGGHGPTTFRLKYSNDNVSYTLM